MEYTPYDYAIINLISNYFKSQQKIGKQRKILETLLSKLNGHHRVITSIDLNRNVAECMLQKAVDFVHAQERKLNEKDGTKKLGLENIDISLIFSFNVMPVFKKRILFAYC